MTATSNLRFYTTLGLWGAGAALSWPYGLPLLLGAAILSLSLKREYDKRIDELERKTTRDATGRVPVASAPRDLKAFERIFDEAIETESRVGFDYQDRDGNTTEREITPWYTQQMSNGLAVTGHCHLRDGERNFYLDRMSSVRITMRGEKKSAVPTTSESVFGNTVSSLDDIPF